MNEEDIKQIKLNIFYGSQESIDYYNFPWHKLENKIQATKVNSSQALAIDLFGMIKCSNFKNIIIGDIFNTNKNLDWKIEFEWKDKKLLNEKIATQIDLKISSEEYIFLIEFKFTENQEGTCSQVNKITSGKNKGLIQCDGNYKLQKNPVNNIEEKCSLTGKNIDYWKLIPEIFDLKQENDYLPYCK